MLSFEMSVLIIILCGILAIILLIIAVICAIIEGTEISTIFATIAALLSAIITVVSYSNITIPTPIILPLDNDTKTYTDNIEITIKSSKSKFIKTYYTLDGTDPENGEIYVDEIIITDSTTVCARNKFLGKWSDIATNAYIFQGDSSNPAPDSAPEPVPKSESEPTPDSASEPLPDLPSDPMPDLASAPASEPESDSTSDSELVSIRNVSEFYSDGIEHREYTIIDNIGNSYEGYTFMVAGNFFIELEGSAVYRNDDQYTRFLGRVIIDQSEKNDEDCGWIKIYGDNTLLFDTGTMGRGIIPVDFDLDISMYGEIKIDFKTADWSTESLQYPQCYLVNTYFERK